MVESLEILHLHETDQVKIQLHSSGGLDSAPPVDFKNPLEKSDYEEISWYFQEYFSDPTGEGSARSEAVETGLRNLGRVLFENTFKGNEEAFQIYSSATSKGLADCTLAIVSDQPDFLGLPWELMNDPDNGYSFAQMASITRRVEETQTEVAEVAYSTDQFNVLIISPMPDSVAVGSGDEELPKYGQQSTEALNVLESLNIQVELDYLRPPTWAALQELLGTKQDYYHLVHFDSISLTANEDSSSPLITLEDTSGAADHIPVTDVAKSFKNANIPIVLCSGGNGSMTEPILWSRTGQILSHDGIMQTGILPYSIHGSTHIGLFLREIYQSIAKGDLLSTAITKARIGLMNDPHRLTISGKKLSWDWISPQAFQSIHHALQAIEEDQPDPTAPPVIQPEEEPDTGTPLPVAGQYGLIGRSVEIRQLERLFENNPVVLLTGPTGNGKTELALGFARWAERTSNQTLPGGVFYSTFEASHPTGLERIIHEIGTSAAGLPFADMNARQQRNWVADYLKTKPSLLIWDNFQNVAGNPLQDGSGLLTPAEQRDLDEFISDVTQNTSTSRILLVSNDSDLSWMKSQHTSHSLDGLNKNDRLLLAAHIIEKTGVEAGRITTELTELLKLLQGHPLAIQIALPILKQVPMSTLISEIQGNLDNTTLKDQLPEYPSYLSAVMEYSWSKMSRRNRTHLPMLAIFQRRVMMDILNHITQEPAYKNVMGEELGWGACRTMLRTALTDGFLEPISPSVYQIHQSIPQFLGQKLTQQLQGPSVRQLELEFLRVYADTADYFMESLYENQASGVTAILAEEGNLTQAMGLALEAEQWDNAQLLVQPLAQVYRMQKRHPELQRLRAQLLEVTGSTASEATEKGAVELWIYLKGTAASEATELLDIPRAEELNEELLEYLTAQPDGGENPQTAAVYHQSAVIALRRGNWDESAGWLEKSLAIIEDGEDLSSIADDYYLFGQLRQNQRLYTEAKDWYKKALDAHQRVPDEEEMVKDYRALGTICQLKFEYQEAQSWYFRARDMVEESRDEETAIQIYHQLGTLHHAQYEFDEAKELYQQALHLSDRMGNREQMITEFHHLGLLAQTRGILFDEAEEWYLIALEYLETLGDQRGMGDESRQLGVLFHEQKKYDEALEWYTQARDIFEQMGDVQRLARTYGQIGMVYEEKDDVESALEWVSRTYKLTVEHELPVVIQVKAHLGRLRDKVGPDEFSKWWETHNEGEVPTDLDVDTSTIF